MSNVSTSHAIVPFDSAKSKAFTGQRLSKVSYKTKKVNGVESKLQSVCASIPQINPEYVAENLTSFTGHVIELIERTQDAMIREMYESGLSNVPDESISIQAVLAYLDSQASGARLSKEQIAAWFDTSLADTLSIAFADKIGIDADGSNCTPEMEQKVAQAVNVYRDKISSLSGSKTKFAPEVCTKLLKALEFCADDDLMGSRLVKRLEAMQKVETADMLGL